MGGVRDAASKALTYIGKPAVELLTRALNNEKDNVREKAAEALGNIGDERAVEFLIKALKDESVLVGKNAAMALEMLCWEPKDDAAKVHYLLAKGDLNELADLGESAVESLIQVLNDKNIGIRGSAAVALGNAAEVRAIEPLIQALKDEDVKVRWNAAAALGALGDHTALEPLIEACNDEAERLQEASVEALVKLGGPKVTEVLIQALTSRDWHFHIRDEFAKALGKIGDKKAAAAVIEHLVPKRAICGGPEPERFSAFRNLLGDYTSLILEAGTYSKSEKTVGISDPVTHYTYVLNEDAVKKLCKIDSPISSNILRMLEKTEDTEKLIAEEAAYGTRYEILSCEPIRKLAQDELKNRGNPPYDPFAYLEEDAWNI